MNTRTNVTLHSEGGRARPSEIAGGLDRLAADCRYATGQRPGQQRETTDKGAHPDCGSNGVFMLQFNAGGHPPGATE